MTRPDRPISDLMTSLKERAKELNCLYAVEEILNVPEISPEEACRQIVDAIPPGLQYTDICRAEIELLGVTYRTPDFTSTPWVMSAEIRAQDEVVGKLRVYYREEVPEEESGPFLKEETRLIKTIADRYGHYFHHHRMRRHFNRWESASKELRGEHREDWRIVMQLLERTDPSLHTKISHMMLNHLCWSGIKEAEVLLQESDDYRIREGADLLLDSNVPAQRREYTFPEELVQETFRIASSHLSDEEIFFRVQKWVQENRLGFLVRAVERNQSLPQLTDAIRRYEHLSTSEGDLSEPVRKVVRVALIRRFLSDQLDYIRVAKEYIGIRDFYDLQQRIVSAPDSHGQLGGKTAGLLLARHILKDEVKNFPELGEVKTPRTWHVTSDMQHHFMHYNNLDEVIEQKYKDIGQIRFEYPHIVRTCKNSRFPPEFLKGLSLVLDDLGEIPVIVRSSSVLEDRVGAAFSGKYKSLFLANQGSKQERLEALLDAIAEVYASMFGPDPIEYRAERGLLDFEEEMGILIQQVVGRRIGKYYFPVFAGVAFSRNEFRWSPRIKREDGLIRLVPGLGTRAVDRLSDDYPVMFAPGQPGLRVNVSNDEIVRYSPRFMDVLNLETNRFETREAAEILSEVGDEMPGYGRIVSILSDGHIRRAGPLDTGLDKNQMIVTFEGLMSDPKAVQQMKAILSVLEEKLGGPVDLEFAHDGETLYLLQCRVQSYSDDSGPAPIPKDLSPDRVLFTANRFISNGRVPDATHVVYVDPERYGELAERSELVAVGRAVSRLNTLLPKRKFILMGPGRWGSRGDIKLGVSVTYSDINNTSVLIEVARKKGNYTPDLSFGTHFFQDLVEAHIRYLPLYPDEEENLFNEGFLRSAPNILPDLLPDEAWLADTIKVIDVTKATDGLVLRVLMNADLDEAVGLFADPSTEVASTFEHLSTLTPSTGDHWRWRKRMAEFLASQFDAERFGAEALYLFGSTKNHIAGPASDIDLLVHFTGTPEQEALLLTWFEAWSLSLDEMNYIRTGYRSGGLIDLHLITDEDIERKTSYAVKIGAVTDAAQPLEMKRADSE
jgi:pyruvate, water dikinase